MISAASIETRKENCKGRCLGVCRKSAEIIKENIMQGKITTLSIIGWIFGIAVFAIGVLNLFLVHPFRELFTFFFLSFTFLRRMTFSRKGSVSRFRSS